MWCTLYQVSERSLQSCPLLHHMADTRTTVLVRTAGLNNKACQIALASKIQCQASNSSISLAQLNNQVAGEKELNILLFSQELMMEVAKERAILPPSHLCSHLHMSSTNRALAKWRQTISIILETGV